MHSGTWNLLMLMVSQLHVPVLDLILTSVCGAPLCSPWFHLSLLQILRFPPTDHTRLYACLQADWRFPCGCEHVTVQVMVCGTRASLDCCFLVAASLHFYNPLTNKLFCNVARCESLWKHCQDVLLQRRLEGVVPQSLLHPLRFILLIGSAYVNL